MPAIARSPVQSRKTRRAPGRPASHHAPIPHHVRRARPSCSQIQRQGAARRSVQDMTPAGKVPAAIIVICAGGRPKTLGYGCRNKSARSAKSMRALAMGKVQRSRDIH